MTPESYIQCCKTCGRISYATVNREDGRTADDVAEIRRTGGTVYGATCAEVRSKGAWCECWKEKRTAEAKA